MNKEEVYVSSSSGRRCSRSARGRMKAEQVSKLRSERGLWGLEAWSSEVSEKNHQELLRLAKENGLVATGGR